MKSLQVVIDFYLNDTLYSRNPLIIINANKKYLSVSWELGNFARLNWKLCKNMGAKGSKESPV